MTPLKQDFRPGQPVSSVPASWFNAVADFLNNLIGLNGISVIRACHPPQIRLDIDKAKKAMGVADLVPNAVDSNNSDAASAATVAARAPAKVIERDSAQETGAQKIARLGTSPFAARADHVHTMDELDLDELDLRYALKSHTHSNYAAADHRHDQSYAAKDHSHDETYVALDDFNDALDSILDLTDVVDGILSDYITSADLESYVTNTALNTTLAAYSNSSDIASTYATLTAVSNLNDWADGIDTWAGSVDDDIDDLAAAVEGLVEDCLVADDIGVADGVQAYSANLTTLAGSLESSGVVPLAKIHALTASKWMKTDSSGQIGTTNDNPVTLSSGLTWSAMFTTATDANGNRILYFHIPQFNANGQLTGFAQANTEIFRAGPTWG